MMGEDEWDWDGTRSNLVNQFNLTCGNTYKVTSPFTMVYERNLESERNFEGD